MMAVEQSKPMRLIDLKEVTARTTLSKSSIYDLMKDGSFPKQVKLGSRSVAWVESEVEEFVLSAINNRSSQEKSS